MDLRPLNLYYQKEVPVTAKMALARRTKAYSYPYTWIPPVTDRDQVDVDILNQFRSLGWADMDTAQKNYYLYGNKNQIPYPYPVGANTENGIETSIPTKGCLIVSGRPISAIYQKNITIIAPGYTKLNLETGQYHLSGCPAGGSEETYCIAVYRIGPAGMENLGYDTGDGITFNVDTEQYQYLVYIRIAKAYYDVTPNPVLTFYPVLRGINDIPSGLIGAMHQVDFGRIENDIQILLDVLELDSNSYVEDIPEFLTEEYFTTLKKNLGLIRAAYCVHKSTPGVPELPYDTWKQYNAIEQILADVYETINAQFSYYAGGEIYSGEDTGLLL